ncbi:MAG: MetQ/NlpA family ABC transporter substrate-binding protein [Erysipelotrichaceae bacterium]|nr:MetQ/NlpA family ABC transporter substrate-binding protein [Erysipelotrichaceae bacterium]
MKKTLTVILAVLLSLTLAACGGNGGKQDEKVIKVGATLVPHAEILKNVVADKLAKDGWTLEVVEFNDYVTPNTALEEGELDANYFQTLGYMKDQNENGGLHLTAVAGVHIEPMGIYSKKYTSLDQIPDGATIGVPNDTDNCNRALDLLAAWYLITGTGTPEELNSDPVKNPHGYKITLIEAAGLPRSLDDLDAAVINGNYALEAGLPETSPAVQIEVFNAETSVRRTNYIVVKQGSENSEKIQALVKAINSKEVEDYINNTYKGAVIPSFVDAEGKPLN